MAELRAILAAHLARTAAGDAPEALAGFPPFPGDLAATRRDRAWLGQFAWLAYLRLAGAPPAAAMPTEWPWHLPAVSPLRHRAPAVPPALARLVERILTAPPLAPLPSAAGIEEVLRRSLQVLGGRPAPAAPQPDVAPLPEASPRATTVGVPASLVVDPAEAAVVAEVAFRPRAPEALPRTLEHLRLLVSVLRGHDGVPVAQRREALFRVGWSGWERLAARPPYARLEPFVLRVGHDEPLPSLAALRPDVPGPLVDLLERLLATAPDAQPPFVREVLDILRAVAEDPALADVAADPTLADTAAHTTTVPDSAAPPTGDAGSRRVAVEALLRTLTPEAEAVLAILAGDGALRRGVGVALARSLAERVALARLAWASYLALAGHPPILHDEAADAAAPYEPLAVSRPDLPESLATVIDRTLVPVASGTMPGVAVWMAALEEASAVLVRRGLVPIDAPPHDGDAPRRRSFRLLPDDGGRPARVPWLPLAVAGLALAVTLALLR